MKIKNDYLRVPIHTFTRQIYQIIFINRLSINDSIIL